MEFSELAQVDISDVMMARESDARPIKRIAMIGNFLPRQCGIATYTTDIYRAFESRFPHVEMSVWAMNDGANRYDYPDAVKGSIDADNPESYRAAARDIEAFDPDMLWIQHEFGIFGGAAGNYLLPLLDRLTCPIAVAMHSVLREPDPEQRRVTEALIARCDLIIVMANEGRRILAQIYGADPARIAVIPHGIPDRPFAPTGPMKERLGFAGREVILTFGLLSPGKGIETMIEAMPAVVERFPQALYVVVGATHPHLIAHEGEAYRERLIAQAAELGVADHLHWVNTFLETEELLDYLEAADVYVTPYLNPQQITSGTLSYAVGLGKPVVSTPYVHARELLANHHGRLVDFGDSAGFAGTIISLLSDPDALLALRERTYALGRTMIWPRLAEASIARFESIPYDRAMGAGTNKLPAIPASIPFCAVERLTDSTGMIQHSVFSTPDRSHGYCVDDNARALIAICRDAGMDHRDKVHWANIYAGFVQHAWNPDLSTFRNFMSYDRRWLEDVGSDDSCGRTVWALAIAATRGPDAGVRHWAEALFDRSIGPTSARQSLRTRAFLMLAAEVMLKHRPGDAMLVDLMNRFGDDLVAQLGGCRRSDWNWFETVLAYDNTRLPEALIRAGLALDRNDFVVRGLETLTWISDRQIAREGHFRAVGSDSFGRPFSAPLKFDQQPVEAWAMIDACDAAFAATDDLHWIDLATRAYRWFLGSNDLGLAMADVTTGECFDGLMPTGINRNQGAESVLAFYMGTLGINLLIALKPNDEKLARSASQFIWNQPKDVVALSVSAQASRRPFARRGAPVSPRVEQSRAF